MSRGESLTSVCCGVLWDRCICSHAARLHVQGMSAEQRGSMNTNTRAWLKLRGAVTLQLSPRTATSDSRKMKKKVRRKMCN